MDFTEDFCAVQGILSSVHQAIGDFSSLNYRGGNESKISKVVEVLRTFLSSKKYIRKCKINPSYEQEVREIHLFLLLNTEFTNKDILMNDNKFSHLIDVTPQMTRCLFTNIVWDLEMVRFYCEAICSLPVAISLQLLENCNKCIKRTDPYVALEHVAMVAVAIYVKIYNLRYENHEETKVNSSITKLLERFTEILQNYITPEKEKMSDWQSVELYRYLGMGIFKILSLVKCCLNMFVNDAVGDVHEIYQVKTTGPGESPERLDKSAQALKKCNICLMSVCQANLEAVTVDVYLTWSEYKHNNQVMQQMIGNLAYEVRHQLDHFEECGNLPSMLEAIMSKPKTLEEIIKEADEEKILQNVIIQDSNQKLWLKALLKHGIYKSSKTFDVFKSVIHLCEKEDYLYLLEYGATFVKNNEDLLNVIINNIITLDDNDLMSVIAEYFKKYGLNNIYEMKTFNVEINTLFNQMNSCDKNDIAYKEIALFLLQNPEKLIAQLLIESLKNMKQLVNMVNIFKFIHLVCDIVIQGSEDTVLTEMVFKFLTEYNIDLNSVEYATRLIGMLLESNLLTENSTHKLLLIVENFTMKNEFNKSLVIIKIYKEVSQTYIKNFDYLSLLSTLSNLLSKIRWNFFTYTNEKESIVTELIIMIKKYKTYITSRDALNAVADKLSNPTDIYYILSENETFLKSVNPEYDKDGEHVVQVAHLFKLLPFCCPDEWKYVFEYLIIDKNPVDIFDMIVDVMLLLTVVAKQTADNFLGLSYCFQQSYVQIKDIIYPRLTQDEKVLQIFIKKICKLIATLPKELQNSTDINFISLFDINVLQSMKSDVDFLNILVPIKDLEVGKIICKHLSE